MTRPHWQQTASHSTVSDESRDWAIAHVLGSLDDADAEGFERHLETCGTCRSEVEALRSTTGALSLLAPSVAPPEGLRQRLLDRVGVRVQPTSAESSQPWKGWDAPCADLAFVPGSAGIWESTSSPGVEARRLFVDAAVDRITMLIRMAPGSSYPGHVHGGPEECYVISGDLRVGDALHMRAGDYQRVGKGLTHPVQSTDGGCLLLIVSSMHDELLSDHGR